MAELEYQGIKFKGGKLFIILSLIGAIIGGGWSAYKFYDDYLDMKAKIQSYTAPDMSHIEEQIAVLQSEINMVLEEVSLVNDVAQSLKGDLREDIKLMKSDIRNIDKIVNDIEDRVKASEREIDDDFKNLEKELDEKITKILSNPLSGVK